MKRLIPLTVLACIALAAIGVVLLRGDGLPGSFTLTLSADLTSSGGGRMYAATLDVDGDTVTGESSYTTSSRETMHMACALRDGVWSDGSGTCPIPLTVPSTRAGLSEALRSESIVPLASCGHKQLCYELTAR